MNPPNYFAVLIYFFTPKLIHKKNSRQASREILLLYDSMDSLSFLLSFAPLRPCKWSARRRWKQHLQAKRRGGGGSSCAAWREEGLARAREGRRNGPADQKQPRPAVGAVDSRHEGERWGLLGALAGAGQRGGCWRCREAVSVLRAAVPRASRGRAGGAWGGAAVSSLGAAQLSRACVRDSRALRGGAADGSAGASATGRARSCSPS